MRVQAKLARRLDDRMGPPAGALRDGSRLTSEQIRSQPVAVLAQDDAGVSRVAVRGVAPDEQRNPAGQEHTRKTSAR